MPPLSVNIHVFADIIRHDLHPFQAELEYRLTAIWARSTPVSAERWLEHVSYIRDLPQTQSVHAVIKHATDMRKYFDLDLEDSLVLLLGLLPLHWKPKLAVIGWNPLQESTHLAVIQAEQIWAVWQLLCYLCYIVFNDALLAPRECCEEADLLCQMRLLLRQNPDDEYLSELAFPFFTRF